MKDLLQQKSGNPFDHSHKYGRTDIQQHQVVLNRRQKLYYNTNPYSIYRTDRSIQKSTVYKLALFCCCICDLRAPSQESIYKK